MTKHKNHDGARAESPEGAGAESASKENAKSEAKAEAKAGTEAKPEPKAEAKQEAKPVDASAKNAAEEIDKLKKALAEAEDKRIRVVAEMENLRKRLAKDMETQRLAVQTDTLSAFLQVFDHFSMAVNAAKASDNQKAVLEGMKMIDAEFGKAFHDVGVEFLNAEGKDFDPNMHEAIAQEHSDKLPAGKVLRQWSSACKLGQRLLRPARVVVSAGPAPAEAPKA